jgi:hypothetical protein
MWALAGHAEVSGNSVERQKEEEMATIGYLEGVDPLLLTKLAVQGIGTVPLSNGFDMHGKYMNHLTKQDRVSVVVGYLHKVLPYNGAPISPRDLLFACVTHEIPVLLIAGRSEHEGARRLLGEMADKVRLVDPADLYAAILQVVS